MSAGPPGPTDIEQWLRLAVDELIDSGRLDRDVEFVHAWGLGLPSGTAAAVERAFEELVDRDVLLIVGPAIGDNALVVTPLADGRRLPTINWAGSERGRGEYMFHLQVGSHEDEPVLLANYLSQGPERRVGVVYDRSPIGRRYLEFFLEAAEALGLEIATVEAIAPLSEDADRQVARIIDSGVDTCLYLGLGHAAEILAGGLVAAGWNGTGVMNSAGIRGYAREYARRVDGWVYVDMYSDHNMALSSLCRRLSLSPERRLAAAKGYDLGRLVAEGLARAPELTRDGVKAGLERVKWLPAAQGHEGTLLGFGRCDRGALHGRYLVLRRWQGGKSVQV